MGSRLSLVLGIVALAVWITLGLIVPVGSGWIHLLLGAGVILIIRGIVIAPGKTETDS